MSTRWAQRIQHVFWLSSIRRNCVTTGIGSSFGEVLSPWLTLLARLSQSLTNYNNIHSTPYLQVFPKYRGSIELIAILSKFHALSRMVMFEIIQPMHVVLAVLKSFSAFQLVSDFPRYVGLSACFFDFCTKVDLMHVKNVFSLS